MPIIVSQLAGCLVGLVSVTIIAKLLGASPEVIMSLAPKSVTTPIAMEVSDAVGGIPSLTAAVVIVVGTILGAICGFKATSGRTCWKSYSARAFDGNSFACGRNIACYGGQWKVWSLCQSGIDSERYFDCFAYSYYPSSAGTLLNYKIQCEHVSWKRADVF